MSNHLARTSIALQPREQEVWNVVQGFEFPFTLIDLSDFRVLATNHAASQRLNAPREDVIGHSVFERIRESDRSNAQVALEALRDGQIDFYFARRYFEGSIPPDVPVCLCARAIDFEDRRVAFVALDLGNDLRPNPLAEYLGSTKFKMAVGMTDAEWKVTSVSCDISDALGIDSQKLLGRPLLDSAETVDVCQSLRAGIRDGESCSLAMRFNTRDPSEQRRVRCVLTPLADSSWLFILLPESRNFAVNELDAASRLEQYLWGIASDVHASGVLQNMGAMPSANYYPQLDTLSTRQWEVLSRLMRGERVATISAALFISKSTVRNTLSAIFKKFNVHSQVELLSLLQE